MKSNRIERSKSFSVGSLKSFLSVNETKDLNPKRIVTHHDSGSVLYSFDELKSWIDFLGSDKNFKKYMQDRVNNLKKADFDCKCSEIKHESSSDNIIVPCCNRFVNEKFECICEQPLDMKLNNSDQNSGRGKSPDDKHQDAKNISIATAPNVKPASDHFPTIYSHFIPSTFNLAMKDIHYCVDPTIFEWDTGLKALPCDGLIPGRIFPFEFIDHGILFYRSYFYGRDHVNYCGELTDYGPVVISITRVKPRIQTQKSFMEVNLESNHPRNEAYLLIFRSCLLDALRIQIPKMFYRPNEDKCSFHQTVKEVVEYIFPQVNTAQLFLEFDHQQMESHLLKFDEEFLNKNFKIGVVYCKAGQTNEEEMYENDEASPAFFHFMDLLGKRVNLKGFEQFSGGLDIRNDQDGTESYYTSFQGREIMFHVSPMMPHPPDNIIVRKSKIGNDAVNIVFQDSDDCPLDPTAFQTQYTNAFIMVRVHDAGQSCVSYSVAVAKGRFIPYAGPVVYRKKFSHNDEFRNFLLTKAINAEHSIMLSTVFEHRAINKRHFELQQLCAETDKTCSLESLGKRSLFKKSTSKLKLMEDCLIQMCSTYGISHQCEIILDGFSTEKISSILVTCFYSISFLDPKSKRPIFSCPVSQLLGWYADSEKKAIIFFDSKYPIILDLSQSDETDFKFIKDRLVRIASDATLQDAIIDKPCKSSDYEIGDQGDIHRIVPDSQFSLAGLKVSNQVLAIDGKLIFRLSQKEIQGILGSDYTKILLYRSQSILSKKDNLSASRRLESLQRQALTPNASTKSQDFSFSDDDQQESSSEAMPTPPTTPDSMTGSRYIEFDDPGVKSSKKTVNKSPDKITSKINRLNLDIGVIIEGWDEPSGSSNISPESSVTIENNTDSMSPNILKTPSLFIKTPTASSRSVRKNDMDDAWSMIQDLCDDDKFPQRSSSLTR